MQRIFVLTLILFSLNLNAMKHESELEESERPTKVTRTEPVPESVSQEIIYRPGNVPAEIYLEIINQVVESSDSYEQALRELAKFRRLNRSNFEFINHIETLKALTKKLVATFSYEAITVPQVIYDLFRLTRKVTAPEIARNDPFIIWAYGWSSGLEHWKNNIAQALEIGDEESLNKLLEENERTLKVDLNSVYIYDIPLLYFAIKQSCIECIEALLKKGIDPNKIHPMTRGMRKEMSESPAFGYNLPPLLMATVYLLSNMSDSPKSYEIIKALIDAGANINAKTARGDTVLTLSVRKLLNYYKTPAVLLEDEADLQSDFDYLEFLLEHGADVNIVGADGKTILDLLESQKEEYQIDIENLIILFEAYGAQTAEKLKQEKGL